MIVEGAPLFDISSKNKDDDNMSSNDGCDEDSKKTTDAILEMLREAGVSTESLEDTRHAFWDTQVRLVSVMIV